jgi:outer membrane protein assembly factor BamB
LPHDSAAAEGRVLVAGGRVLVEWHTREGKTERAAHFACFDEASGKRLWSKDLPDSTERAAHGDLVFVNDGSSIRALSLSSGEQRWQAKTGQDKAPARLGLEQEPKVGAGHLLVWTYVPERRRGPGRDEAARAF